MIQYRPKFFINETGPLLPYFWKSKYKLPEIIRSYLNPQGRMKMEGTSLDFSNKNRTRFHHFIRKRSTYQ